MVYGEEAASLLQEVVTCLTEVRGLVSRGADASAELKVQPESTSVM